MNEQEKADLLDFIMNERLSVSELDLSNHFDDDDLPWYSQYEEREDNR